jgi:hypothetical protein
MNMRLVLTKVYDLKIYASHLKLKNKRTKSRYPSQRVVRVLSGQLNEHFRPAPPFPRRGRPHSRPARPAQSLVTATRAPGCAVHDAVPGPLAGPPDGAWHRHWHAG